MRAHVNAAFLAGLSMLSSAQAQNVETPGVKISLDWARYRGAVRLSLSAPNSASSSRGIDVTIDRGMRLGATPLPACALRRLGSSLLARHRHHGSFHAARSPARNDGRRRCASGGNAAARRHHGEWPRHRFPQGPRRQSLTATAGSAALALFNIFAKDAGFDPKSVTWKQVSGALREPMMVRGEADAAAGFTTSSVMSIVELGVKRDDVVTFKYNDYGLNSTARRCSCAPSSPGEPQDCRGGGGRGECLVHGRDPQPQSVGQSGQGA